MFLQTKSMEEKEHAYMKYGVRCYIDVKSLIIKPLRITEEEGFLFALNGTSFCLSKSGRMKMDMIAKKP